MSPAAESPDSSEAPNLKGPFVTQLPYILVRRLKSLPGYDHVGVEFADTPRDGESLDDLAERVGREADKRLKNEIRRAFGRVPEGQKQETLGND